MGQEAINQQPKYTAIGGQALIEGVMMRNKDVISIAVRRPNGEILLKDERTKQSAFKGIGKIPFVRGAFNLIASMVVGVRALTYSADIFAEEEEEGAPVSKFDQFMYDKLGDKAEPILVGISIVMAIGLAILLFSLLPTFLMGFARDNISNPVVLSFFEGVLKIVVFLIYLISISQMKDIKRVYQYHGAEHKTIACYEKGLPLTPENAEKCSRLHPRCGTSFVIFVLVISIIVYSFISWESLITRMVIKILLLPLIAGIAYELIRLAGKSDNKIVKIISWPGMQFQKITTKEPDHQQLEVAIAAFKDALEKGGPA